MDLAVEQKQATICLSHFVRGLVETAILVLLYVLCLKSALSFLISRVPSTWTQVSWRYGFLSHIALLLTALAFIAILRPFFRRNFGLRLPLRGAAHVGAAAKLARVVAVSDLDQPHDLAVLFTEQRHRPEPLGLIERRGQRVDRIVLGDPTVHELLDLRDLRVTERHAVREIEAQLVRSDIGAGLPHVITKDPAQRSLQQVRRGVVGLDRVTLARVDLCDYLRALAQLAALDLDRERLIFAEPQNVNDASAETAVEAFNHPRVRNLAAAGCVER